MRVDPKSLVRRLTPTTTKHLEVGVGRAASGQYYEIIVEHVLAAMLDGEEVPLLLRSAGKDPRRLAAEVQRAIERQRAGNPGRPVFSESLFRWMEGAWLFASIELGHVRLSSPVLLLELASRPGRYSAEDYAELSDLPVATLKDQLDEILASSKERLEWEPGPGTGVGAADAPSASRKGGGEALDRFTISYTEKARAGKIDPIFGRDREIRQVIDILSRRRKNNPIVLGEPGVGKTALVEGLARAIVQREVPESLLNVELRELDLGALQAGAGVKGEFENRLKAVMADVRSSLKPIVLFIDEVHTLIGAGGQAGGGDAANLLKPALARGELRTIAATTWKEYKKYFSKDAALERRFQPVAVDEPSCETTVHILRGLRDAYEATHGVTICDEAIVAAAELGARYVSGRQLPDKAVDLIDTAAARVTTARHAKPEDVVAIESKLSAAERELRGLERDRAAGHAVDDASIEDAARRVEACSRDLEQITDRWKRELFAVEALIEARRKLLKTPPSTGASSTGASSADASSIGGSSIGASSSNMSPARVALAPEVPTHVARDVSSPVEVATAEERRADVDRAKATLAEVRGGTVLVPSDVDRSAVAKVISSWTGIPVDRMRADAIQTILGLEDKLRARVMGQDYALRRVSEAVRISSAGIRDPRTPIGVLLFVGPSGVGKTETALTLAEELYGGERFLTTINMSEFQEKHTVSRLIGSPPGYVGFGEGGMLTEAVRQRPYSVVLLDEVEKADLEVMNLFYQVFDKGSLSDSEGRVVDFKNTLIILTSNLASDLVMDMFEEGAEPDPEAVVERIRPVLSQHFKAALLARMSIVPFAPIGPSVMREIAFLKLRSLAQRLRENHRMEVEFDEGLIEEIVRRSSTAEVGGRNVEHILRGSLLPVLSREILAKMAEGDVPRAARIGYSSEVGWMMQFGGVHGRADSSDGSDSSNSSNPSGPATIDR